MSVEVAYALPERQRIVSVQVAPGTTAREAVGLSGIAGEFAGLDSANCPLGIFGKQVDGGRILQPGDRVEIYRPLLNEPRATRRALAATGRTMGPASRR